MERGKSSDRDKPERAVDYANQRRITIDDEYNGTSGVFPGIAINKERSWKRLARLRSSLGSKSGAALHNSAVSKNSGSCNVSGAIPGEKSDDFGDFLRLAHSPERDGAVEFF